jgi:hypothetical protein
MHVVLTLGSLISVVFADSSQRMFLAPAAYTPAMVQPQMQDTVAYNAAVGPYVQMSDPVQPAVQMQSLPYQAPTEREEPAMSSFAVCAVAGALLCGAVTALRRETAVAEPDLEAATSAASLAKVAILFSIGSKTNASPKKTGARGSARKPAPKRVARPAPKRVAKPAPKRAATRSARGNAQDEGGIPELPFQNIVKNFFSEENWIYQLVTTLQKLPSSAGDKTNNLR